MSTGGATQWREPWKIPLATGPCCRHRHFLAGSAMAWWSMIRMPGKSHQGPLPPADSALERLASELRSHVATLARSLFDRRFMRFQQGTQVQQGSFTAWYHFQGSVDRTQQVASADLAHQMPVTDHWQPAIGGAEKNLSD